MSYVFASKICSLCVNMKHLIRAINFFQVTSSEAEQIEATTHKQSQCRQWHEERQWRITASRFGDIHKATKRRKMDLLCKSVYAPKNLTNKAVLHGRKFEKMAIKKLEEERNIKVGKCGLYIDAVTPYIAATPDGITDAFLIEVKCPYKGREEKIRKSATYFPFLTKDQEGKLILKQKHNYYAQIQGQMMIAKKQQCLFAVYTLVDFVVIDVKFDDVFCRNLRQSLVKFYTKFYRPYVARQL